MDQDSWVQLLQAVSALGLTVKSVDQQTGEVVVIAPSPQALRSSPRGWSE